MDRWDMLIMAGAAYVAIMSLVRLMAHRRNTLVAHMRDQIANQAANPPQETDASADQDAA